MYIMNKVRNKMINKEAKSYLAKLLATENITVEHRKVETAYFDLGNRLLVDYVTEPQHLSAGTYD